MRRLAKRIIQFLMVIKFLICFSLLFPGIAVCQTLPLNDLIGKVYETINIETDTLLFVESGICGFIVPGSTNSSGIKLILLKNDKQLLDTLSTSDAYLLKLNISEVYANRMVVDISINLLNKRLYNSQRKFLIFHDQRKVECILNKEEKWIFSKTLKVKSHLTD